MSGGIMLIWSIMLFVTVLIPLILGASFEWHPGLTISMIIFEIGMIILIIISIIKITRFGW